MMYKVYYPYTNCDHDPASLIRQVGVNHEGHHQCSVPLQPLPRAIEDNFKDDSISAMVDLVTICLEKEDICVGLNPAGDEFNRSSLSQQSEMKATTTLSQMEAEVSSGDPSIPSSRIKSPKKKQVTFSTTEIREYAVVVGDHPFCGGGLPLSLDWKFDRESIVVDVGVYGKTQSGQPRRLTYNERKNILRKVSGFTESQFRRYEEKQSRQHQLKWEQKNGVQLEVDTYSAQTASKSLHHVSTCKNLADFSTKI